MSFLNKIKGWGQDRGAPANRRRPRTIRTAFDDAFAQPTTPEPRRCRTMPLEVPTLQQTGAVDSSIITEAAPSEMADFSETRIQGGDAANDVGSGLPLIGHRPVARAAEDPRRRRGRRPAGLVI
jgi:twitching motility protein PilJ